MAKSHRIEWNGTSVPTCRRRRVRSVLSTLFLVGLLQITGGCAAARLTQFHNFAQAGTAYTKASQSVLDEAGTAAIEADSLTAQKGRDGLGTAEKRRQYILENNQELRKRLALLGDIGRHGRLLQGYFETLAQLSDPKAPDTLGTAAKGVFDSIGGLSPAIKNASLFGVKIGDKIPPATNFVVQTFKAKALENELKARAKDIEREIALQEAAFTVISSTMETDLTVQLQLEETDEVNEPFATAKELPKNWLARREEILRARVAAASSKSTQEAAAKLRESFVALVENRLSEPSIAGIIAAINSMLTSIEAIKKATPTQ
jgi:hypothetical protein